MTFRFNPGQERARNELLTQGKRYNLLYGGSRSGKTALLCTCDQDRALYAPGSRHLIVRKEQSAAKIGIARDTFPKMWSLRYPDVPQPTWHEKDGFFSFPNGSEVWIGGLNDDKAVEKMLGREYVTIHGEEISEWPYQWFTLLRTRLAQVVTAIDGKDISQRFYGSLNPTTRMHWTYRLWIDGVDPEDNVPIDRSSFGHCVINPYDNAENLSPDTLADLEALPERDRKRFLLGEYIADDDKALWRREYIQRVTLTEEGRLPVEMQRIVIAIDPALSSKPGSDETGIVAVGMGVDGRGYVIADESGRYRPEEWARRAVSLYYTLGAHQVVSEKNAGGDMVEATLRAQDPRVPYKPLTAISSKWKRAEPIAGLYEQGKVFHVGSHTALEDQMMSVTVDFDRKGAGWSPDRVDALVWGLWEFFAPLSGDTSQPRITAPQFSMV